MPYKYADAPKPAPDATNGFVSVPMVERAPNGEIRRFAELAPVPETQEGGYYKDSSGRVHDANGVTLFDPFAPKQSAEDAARQDAHDEIVLAAVAPQMGTNNPVVQQILARKRAREMAAREQVAKDEQRPIEQEEDVVQAKQFKPRR